MFLKSLLREVSFNFFWMMFEILSTCCSYGFTDRRECHILSLFNFTLVLLISRQDVESYIVKFVLESVFGCFFYYIDVFGKKIYCFSKPKMND